MMTTESENEKLEKAKNLLSRVGIKGDETLQQLHSRYGANTYDIVLNAMLRPADMMNVAGQEYANSRKQSNIMPCMMCR